jgi:hypothetical protein
VRTIPEEIFDAIFQGTGEPHLNQELCSENNNDDDNDTVSDEHVRPPPTHKPALQYVLLGPTNLNSQINIFSCA